MTTIATATQKQLSIQLDTSKTGKEAESLETGLRRRIVGQDEAIQQIVNIYQMQLTGMNAPGRPIGNFLFLGPTGSGKTRTVEALAESLLGTSRAVVKIDCAEFQHSHEIAKLIGSPPGYMGHRETPAILNQEALVRYHTDKMRLSFVLFDEIEKASDALWNLLLGIFDKATLTLGDNRRVDFSRAMIFMTSNLGAKEMGSILSPSMGFSFTNETEGVPFKANNEKLNAKLTRSGMEAARKKFTPEFMNRLDKVVVFRPLGENELRQILEIELNMVQQRIFDAFGINSFVFSLTEMAKQHLLDEGTDTRYGARHLKRSIEKLLTQPLSNLIATEQVRGGDWVRVEYSNELGGPSFIKEAEGLSIQAMDDMVDESVTLSIGTTEDVSFVSGRVLQPQKVIRSKKR